MITFSEIVEAQICRIHAVSLIGIQGKSMDEEKELFSRLNDRVDEIEAKKSTSGTSQSVKPTALSYGRYGMMSIDNSEHLSMRSKSEESGEEFKCKYSIS